MVRRGCKNVKKKHRKLKHVHACVCVCVSKWVLSSHKPFLLPDFSVTDCKRRRANKRAKLTVSSD